MLGMPLIVLIMLKLLGTAQVIIDEYSAWCEQSLLNLRVRGGDQGDQCLLGDSITEVK